MINSELTFTCKLFATMCFIGCVMDLTGCASMEMVTDQDKISQVVLPEGVTVHFYDWPEQYPNTKIANNTGAYYESSTKSIHTLKGNYCLYKHEAKHAWQHAKGEKLDHEGWPKRIVGCRV